MPAPMSAVSHTRYGGFEQLQLRSLPRPVPQPDEILVRVRAVGLHVADCFSVRGSPFIMRFSTGLLRPKKGIPGFDFAGEVTAIGSAVTEFAVGAAVFGASEGTCVEYLTITPDKVALKPKLLSFEEAAAVPSSALAALHALRDVANVKAGQKILINGASGGVGSFAVQLAKHNGAVVTGVCSTANVERVRALGADAVIDYTKEDFTQGRPGYDLIFDNVENRSITDLRRALTPTGTLIVNSGTGATGFRFFVRLIKPLLISPFIRQRLRRYLSIPSRADLVVLSELIEAGKLRPLIDRRYPLKDTPDALAYIERGHASGKVVVTI